MRDKRKKMTSKSKTGCIDRVIESLPEIHMFGYRYCGPNTNLHARLSRGERGINKLDCACMEHDIAYSVSKDLQYRCIADKSLLLKAFRRIYAKDSRIGERFVALTVSLFICMKLICGKIELNLRKCLTIKSQKKQCAQEEM